MIIKAIIQPMRALTKPKPPPKISSKMFPAHVTRDAYENPVVARKTAEEDAINASNLVCVLV